MDTFTPEDLEKLRPLYNRWQHIPVPEDLWSIAEEIEFRETSLQHFALWMTFVTEGLVSKERAVDQFKAWHEMLTGAIRGAIIIGLELASRLPPSSQRKDLVEVLTFNLSFSEWSTIDACLSITRDKLETQSKYSHYPLDEKQQEALGLINQAQSSTDSQARKSSGDITPSRLEMHLSRAKDIHALMIDAEMAAIRAVQEAGGRA